jgi:hypothetical protein
MAEESDELKALKASHGKIEEAIQGHLSELGIDGLLTGWVLAVAVTSFDGDDDFDGLYSTQSDGLSKWTQIGMLVSALDSAKIDGLRDDDD